MVEARSGNVTDVAAEPESSPSAVSVASNLPVQLTSFVGREAEIAAVRHLLAARRLVTLAGAGGCGKTRLALQVAASVADQYPDGAWWVDLAPLVDASLVPATLAGVAGVGQSPVEPIADTVVAYLSSRRALVVMDNCEHLIDACAALAARILLGCPAATVLATSREPLGVVGEHTWAVPPLSLPPRDRIGPATLKASEAGALFVERATATNPGFRLTRPVARTVAEICRRLDGIPLAIELAAARLTSLSPNDVLARLDNRRTSLSTRSHTIVARHRSLSASLDWSHDLLSPAEATLLRRVSVFEHCNLSAAQVVCAGGEVERNDVGDHLAALVAKSLVVVHLSNDGVRYSLLETVRAWARAKLEEAAEVDVVSRRHALWCLDLAKRSQDELGSNEPQPWLDRLDVEHDNLLAALEWARATGNIDAGVRLATALAAFWRSRGHLQEGVDWLEWALAASIECPAVLRAEALRATGLLRGMLGDITSALPLLEQSSALFAEAGDHNASQCTCSSMFHMFKNPRQAVPRLEKEIERCKLAGNNDKLAHFLWALGQAHFLLGEMSDARRRFERCVELGRAATDGEAMRSGLLGLGRVAVVLGEHEVAEARFEEAKANAEKTGDHDDQATTLGLLADLSRTRGDFARAHKLLNKLKRRALGNVTPVSTARTVYFSARLAEAQATDDDNGAGRLFAEALALARGGGGLGFHETRCLLGLGWATGINGDRSAAAGYVLEALAVAQAIGDVQAQAQALHSLGCLARLDGRFDEADTLAHRALELHHGIGDVAGTAASLESAASVAVERERWEVAVRLRGAAQALLDACGYGRSRIDHIHNEEALDKIRGELGEEELARTWAEGASMSAADAVRYAMKGRGTRDRPVRGWDSLTRAERQVAILVGEGLSNVEVGKRIFISPRTVGSHLNSIYQKLDIHSRSALVKEVTALQPEPV